MASIRDGAQFVVLRANGVHDAELVTPDDGADLGKIASGEFLQTIGILVGASGDVRVTLTSGTTITLPALAGGVWHPIEATRVLATGTTATGIVAGYAKGG